MNTNSVVPPISRKSFKCNGSITPLENPIMIPIPPISATYRLPGLFISFPIIPALFKRVISKEKAMEKIINEKDNTIKLILLIPHFNSIAFQIFQYILI